MSGMDKNIRGYNALARLAATAALSACLIVGPYAVSSGAENHGGHPGGGGHGVGHRGVAPQDGGHWSGGRGYRGGHYASPPVVYGSPYCDTPPLLFTPYLGPNQPCY